MRNRPARSGLFAKCPCGFDTKLDPVSAAYHRAHRANHLEVFPAVDGGTRAALDKLIEIHESLETARAS